MDRSEIEIKQGHFLNKIIKLRDNQTLVQTERNFIRQISST